MGKEFANWIKDQIESFGFIDGSDFEVIAESGKNPLGGRPTKEYMISISMAKELAMVQRTTKGKQARLYFIECERRSLAPVNAGMPQVQMGGGPNGPPADRSKSNTPSVREISEGVSVVLSPSPHRLQPHGCRPGSAGGGTG